MVLWNITITLLLACTTGEDACPRSRRPLRVPHPFGSSRAAAFAARYLLLSALAGFPATFPAAAQPQAPGYLHRPSIEVWNTGNGLPQDTVRQFLETRDGYLWMATDGGLVRFDGYDLTVYDRRNTTAMRSDLVEAMLEDGAGHLWVGTVNGLLERRPGGGSAWTRYGTAQGLPSDSVAALRADGTGRVCVETSSGAACRTATGFVPVTDNAGDSADSDVDSAPPAGVAASLAGFSLPEGFAGSDLLTVYRDREGDLWLGSANAGAAVVRQPPFSTIGKKQGLPADQVRSLLPDAAGGLWFGTGGGLTRLRGGAFSTFTVAQGLASDEVIALAGGGYDDLWIGTPDGLSHLRNGKVTTLTAADGLPDDNIRSLLLARDGTLWIGTTHGLARLRGDTSDIRTYTVDDGLGSNVVGSLLEESDGSLWIGTLNGLSHLADGRVRSYGGGTVTALGRDSGGLLWFGVTAPNGGGLFTVAEGTTRRAGSDADYAAARLPTNIYSIVEDGGGHLWLGSSTGVYRIAVTGLRALLNGKPADRLPILRFDAGDGLRLEDCASGGHPEAALLSDGLLWFATAKGASVIDTRAAALDRTAPPVQIETVTVDETAVSDPVAFHVPAGAARLAFHYAGLEFAAPAKVRYRYRLEGFDRGWIDAGGRRTAYYTNIPPGRYRFRVEDAFDGGVWVPAAAAADFTVAPHYYQTPWFYASVALLLASIARQIYLYRLRQVDLRYRAVLAERGRIAREIHDTLAQDIVGISVQLELVARLLTLSIDKAKTQLQQTQALTRRSLAQARASIWELRASTEAADLPARLREAAKQLTQDATGFALEIEIAGSYRPLQPSVEDELLRIAQQAMANTLSHAGAATLRVALVYDAAGVRLEVADDGRGFVVSDEKTGPSGHYGIRGMYERAERAGAELTIDSTPGKGTRVAAYVRQS